MVAIIHDRSLRTGALDDIFFEISDKLGEVATAADCQKLLRKALEMYSLNNIAYFVINVPKIAPVDPFILVTYKEEWVQRYHKMNYFSLDPVLINGLSSIMPLDWRLINRNAPPVQRFFGEANEFRVGRQGLTFPIRGRHGEAALLTITSDDADLRWASDLRLYMRDFHLLAYQLHQAILRAQGVKFDPPHLTPRESECLKWISRGKTVSEVAIILSLTDRTVKFHLDNARQKLQATNITHAVARALQLNVLFGRS